MMDMKGLIPWRKRRGRPQSIDMAQRGDLQDVFREAVEDFFSTGWGLAPWMRKELGWGPAVDVSETDREYRVEVEVPGLKKENLEVTVENGRLHITGEKRDEDKDERGDYLRVERSYGSFSRTLPLPAGVDDSAAEADYKDGVLTIRLPKTGEAAGKKVEIKAPGS